jgi:hypothetical protein
MLALMLPQPHANASDPHHNLTCCQQALYDFPARTFPKCTDNWIDITSAPAPTTTQPTAPEGQKKCSSSAPATRFPNPHSTLLSGEDSPTPRRRRKRRLERCPAHPLHKVRDTIGQKQSTQKLKCIEVPRHADIPSQPSSRYCGCSTRFRVSSTSIANGTPSTASGNCSAR